MVISENLNIIPLHMLGNQLGRHKKKIAPRKSAAGDRAARCGDSLKMGFIPAS